MWRPRLQAAHHDVADDLHDVGLVDGHREFKALLEDERGRPADGEGFHACSGQVLDAVGVGLGQAHVAGRGKRKIHHVSAVDLENHKSQRGRDPSDWPACGCLWVPGP